MGYDNRFKSLNRLQSAPSSLAGQHQPNAVEKQLAKEMAGDLQSREWVDDSVSNLTYHTLRHMHVRGGKGEI
ncbi:unnamed protein product [Didymodactylos carnosus]|uniref:Uncharacterized protein n=1 Tax=Didymodactylos carnosus TaxID=1234261 RepID=A0A813NUV0_9BILA|nr:unnamed protein product [Didymodactylos carnosus]CAF3519208.1 unnamed protein product [Didymodactylos carnosus]